MSQYLVLQPNIKLAIYDDFSEMFLYFNLEVDEAKAILANSFSLTSEQIKADAAAMLNGGLNRWNDFIAADYKVQGAVSLAEMFQQHNMIDDLPKYMIEQAIKDGFVVNPT
jgi:hypothetical protein